MKNFRVYFSVLGLGVAALAWMTVASHSATAAVADEAPTTTAVADEAPIESFIDVEVSDPQNPIERARTCCDYGDICFATANCSQQCPGLCSSCCV